MGYFWQGVPVPLLDWATDSLGSGSVAVESGTYRGDSAELLSQHFQSVTTIERSDLYARRAQQRFRDRSDVTVMHGSSAELMERAMPPRDTPALFWLDAHYSGGQTAGADFVCPALEELTAIIAGRASGNTIVLVDDARSFLPGDDWPSIGQICQLLDKGGMDAILSDDVLVGAETTRLVELRRFLGNARTTQVPSLFPVYRLTRAFAQSRNATVHAATRLRRKASTLRHDRS